MGKKLQYLVIHCTATPEGREVSSGDIRHWHTDPVEKGGRGWKQVGYTDMIHLDGTIERLVSNNEDDIVDGYEITNGVAGINSVSRHVVYVGGIRNKKSCDTRTYGQRESLKEYVLDFVQKHPSVKVAGHNNFAPKDCPCFNVQDWLEEIGVKEENIYRNESQKISSK